MKNMDTKPSNKDDLPFCFVRGSDPRAVTCRGKLQSRRCKLNQEINKELRLRAGAENLYKATSNRKLRDTVALELSFVNSNLQLLKEKLSELNSSVELYQNDSGEAVMPMIPLGLKETKEVNFLEPFSDFILEHYSEESDMYQDAIADITDTRQAARTPSRDAQGVGLLFRYYNLLYYVERRFFPPDRTLGVYFEWYDSLTGVPSCQRTVAFEKACILFNLGGIYTQIGAKQDRTTEKGLDAAVDNFLRAAGIFKHIHETFTNAPSMDLKPQVLQILVSLMLAQARECLYEKLQLQIETMTMKDTTHIHRDLSGEAAQLTLEYQEIHQCIQTDDIHTYIPECWSGFVPLKSEYYKALSHYHASKSIKAKDAVDGEVVEHKENSFVFDESSLNGDVCPNVLRMAHIKESLACHEEAQRLQRMCRDLKNKISLSKSLHEEYLKTVVECESLEEEKKKNLSEDDFDLTDVTINACPKFKLSLTGPDFTNWKVDDPFKKLGPIAIFSARRHWTAPRNVRLQKGSRKSVLLKSHSTGECICKRSSGSKANNATCEVCQKYTTHRYEDTKNVTKNDNVEYGFQLRGDAPVIISYVDMNSLADLGGIKEGDFIVEINGVDVKWCTHSQVAKLIQESSVSLELKIITPMDRNYLKPMTSTSSKGSISTRSIGSSSGVSSGTPSPPGTTSSKSKIRSKTPKGRLSSLSGSAWNPFRRSQSLGKIF